MPWQAIRTDRDLSRLTLSVVPPSMWVACACVLLFGGAGATI